MEHVAVGGVIDEHCVLKPAVDVPEVFDVVAFFEGAVMAVQAVGEQFAMRVEVVEDHVGVGGAAGCEQYDLCE